MSEENSEPLDGSEQRIVELVRALCEAEEELQKLTGGQLDSVAAAGGKTILLSEAQERLRASEETQRRAAETHAAILDALPAHIALIDAKGVILAVNKAWRGFATANEMHGPDYCVGLNYVETCERAGAHGSSEARAAAAGIRRVLAGDRGTFTLEYPCHSPSQPRWFRLMASPVRPERHSGAVVMHVDITERRLAVDALQTTMEEFRTLAESMPQIVWMTRPDGWTIYFNRHWTEYTGLTLEESLGDGWMKPFHPDDRDHAWNSWRKATASTSDYSVEARLRRADGEYRWWLVRGAPQIDAAGKVLKWFGTCTDIHDLKLAEMDISLANRALQMLSACNEKLARAEKEPELLEEICNVAVEIGGYRMAWVGYARDDPRRTIEPMRFAGVEEGYLSEFRISWSEDHPDGQGPSGQTIRSGQPKVCEDLEQDPAFAPWIEKARMRGYRGAIFMPLRNPVRTFGILALYTTEPARPDAEEIRLLERLAGNLAFGLQHLHARDELIEKAALLNATSDAIILRSIDDRILFWNQGAERMYGWPAFEVVGDDPRRLYVTDLEKYDEANRLIMEAGAWTGEQQVRCKDGHEITVDLRGTLLRDETGAPKSILAIASDITERKRLEAQLLRVQRMESIGTLAGGIAHDLNNALAPILMGAGILKDEVSSEQGKQILASMEMSAQHGAELVRQVLSFARGVEGKRIPVNAVHLLNDIRDMIRDTFPKNIDFTFHPSRDLWMVEGDPTQLNQAFTNLCVNARDAMPNGGTLKVTVKNAVLDDIYAGMNPESRPGTYVCIEVEDTGTGIPPAIRDRIFEPFFTTKEIGKGTGLGLSTTMGIVKGHGGFINIYSEMRKGTTFKVYLPAKTTPEAAEQAAVRQTELPRGNGEMVLLVDDESSIRLVAQKMLERFGYRVLLATNGAEAVALYAQHRERISVVLTDMAMPVMDGPTMIVALKTLDPHVNIVGSSGMASQGGVAKAIGAGVKHFIPKPYTAETMLKVLAQVLRPE